MISEKIIEQINNISDASKAIKQLALTILEEEDKGISKFKITYDKLATEYLSKEGEFDDQDK